MTYFHNLSLILSMLFCCIFTAKSSNLLLPNNTISKDSINPVYESQFLSGSILTENNQPAKGVIVSFYRNDTLMGIDRTDANGTYSFYVLIDTNALNIIKVEKLTTEDKYLGVTTFDVARTSRHILDIDALASPYQLLAADVNLDGEIDAADVIHIRNFILRRTPLMPSGVWSFIDKNYIFKNLKNPFGEIKANEIVLTKKNWLNAVNFVAVKMGDVNGNFTSY